MKKGSYRRQYYSAGILPFSIDEDGRVYFLLGKDTKDNTWSDFGGRCEFSDNGIHLNTATREFYEETIGTIMNIQEMKQILKDKVNFTIIQTKTLNGSPYYTYITKIPFKDYKQDFMNRKQFNEYANIDSKFAEKNDIRWITKETLLDSLYQNEIICLRGVFKNTIKKKKSLIQDIGIGTMLNTVDK